jgi:hypothetical protein
VYGRFGAPAVDHERAWWLHGFQGRTLRLAAVRPSSDATRRTAVLLPPQGEAHACQVAAPLAGTASATTPRPLPISPSQTPIAIDTLGSRARKQSTPAVSMDAAAEVASLLNPAASL